MQMYQLLRFPLFLVLLIPLSVHAVTLGEARVNSFLNQPLDVEIDLVGVAPGQHELLRLRIANERHFERLGIAHSQFLADLRFDVVRSGSQWLVRARSTQAVTEPFLDFPLQMTWPGGQMIKQFTLLLDPQKRIDTARTTRTQRATATPTAQRTPAGSTPPKVDSYGPVRSGETLWPIAKKLKPRGITTRQMAMALLRANPEAFINGNVNNLRAGAVLNVPPLAFIEELDAESASREFNAQTRRWQSPVAASPRQPEPATVRSPEPVAAPPAAPAPADVAAAPEAAADTEQPQLRIVADKDKAESAPGSEADLQEQLLVTMEEIESNRLTTGAIESRLARLEAEIERMQQLVDLKDAQIAALQSEVSAREDIQAAAQAVEPALPEAVSPPVSPDTVETQQASAPAPQAPAVTAAVPIATIDTSSAMPSGTKRSWFEQYLWVVWVVLALLGLTALLLAFRRSPQEATAVAAELPAVAKPVARAVQRPPTESAAMRKAEADFRELAKARLPRTAADDALPELPDIDISQIVGEGETDDKTAHEEITDSVLAEMLEESKLLTDRPGNGGVDKTPEVDPATDFSDDDIASWIRELGNETEHTEGRSANDEDLADNDDIPSILTEIDDQLTHASSSEFAQASKIQLDPIDDEPGNQEDDTFTMSLDLARAYLEIGDQEGARDMLKQALAGARNPDHRRQIEELLQQIG